MTPPDAGRCLECGCPDEPGHVSHAETIRRLELEVTKQRKWVLTAEGENRRHLETIRRLEGEVARLKEDAATLSQAAWITANKRAEAAEGLLREIRECKQSHFTYHSCMCGIHLNKAPATGEGE